MMKRSHRIHLLDDAAGKPFGIHMEADYTAEHQQGIKRLLDSLDEFKALEARRTFVIEPWPIKRRLNERMAKSRSVGLFGVREDCSPETPYFVLADDNPLAGEYGPDNFFVVAKDDKGRKCLEAMAEDATRGDITVYSGRACMRWFGRGGLTIFAPSRAPVEWSKMAEDEPAL